MKKLNLWLLASLFVAAFTLTACGDDDDDKKDDPKETVTELMGTWVTVHPEDPSLIRSITINGDNTIICKDLVETFYGKWELKKGNIHVTLDKYVEEDYSKDIHDQFVLQYQKYANGYLLYSDSPLFIKDVYNHFLMIENFYVSEGTTPKLDKNRMADHEMLGNWVSGEGRKCAYNADGTWNGRSSAGFDSYGVYFDLPPVKDSKGNEIKRFIEVAYYFEPSIDFTSEVTYYVIQDGKLYKAAYYNVESLDDLLEVDPYTRGIR